jgi:3-hydroxyisobutyrate dehydrogenase-like beta-hydroxyacid dehydrogenase
MFVDPPVSGSKGPAEAGQLLILASGPCEADFIAQPVFSAVGRKTVWLGEAGYGSRMKLVVNAYDGHAHRRRGRGPRAGQPTGHRRCQAGRCH